MNLVHDQNVHFQWHVFIVLFNIHPQSRASYGYFECGFIPSVVLGLSYNVPVPLGVGKLAGNRQNFLHVLGEVLRFGILGSYMGKGMPVCVSVCSSVHSDICMSVCTSVCLGMFIHLLLH